MALAKAAAGEPCMARVEGQTLVHGKIEKINDQGILVRVDNGELAGCSPSEVFPTRVIEPEGYRQR